MARHVVAPTSELPPGARTRVTLGGRPIVIFNVKGEYYALLDRCPHQAASLCEGHITGFAVGDGPGDYRLERAGEVIRCPWHGWEFDIKTGQSWFNPEQTRVRRFQASVQSGSELVKGPYKVETFEVAVDHDYVVVDL
jgi:3-phenylpropionate/trans-cinnamate dioxygenase ferredoxin subunit